MSWKCHFLFQIKYKITYSAINQGMLNCLLYFQYLQQSLCKLKAVYGILLFLMYALSIWNFFCLSLHFTCLSPLQRIQHNITQTLISIISAVTKGIYTLAAMNHTFNFDFT